MAKQPDPWAEHFRRALIVNTTTPSGSGWLTRAEFEQQAKLTRYAAEKYLRSQMRIGKIEKFLGSRDKNGVVVPQTWYRPKR